MSTEEENELGQDSQEENVDANWDGVRQAALIEIMQSLYPDSQTYANGQLLTENLSGTEDESDVPGNTEPPITEKNPEGVYQIELDVSGSNVLFNSDTYLKFDRIASIEPADLEVFDEYVNDIFTFFEAEPDEEEEEVPLPIEDGVFIASKNIQTSDVHALYLEDGPAARISANGSDPDMFFVLYLDNGQARPIPNYQTLEVMLVEHQLEYGDIRDASPEDATRYNIDSFKAYAIYETSRMPDRYPDWNLTIRFNSGYKPVEPFVRDPGDYFIGDNENLQLSDLGTPYDNLAYSGQTAKEALRDQFENKMICLNASFNDEGNLVGADINAVRILINGYWKLPIELKTYRYYNTLNGYNVPAPTENQHINFLNEFRKAGALTILNDTGTDSPVWNDFAHIAGANTLDEVEYQDYISSTDGGDIFDKEYLTPYEPRGSVKYYSAGVTSQLAEEALNDIQDLSDQAEQQQTLNNVWNNLYDDIIALYYDVNAKRNALEQASNDGNIDYTPQIDELYNDVLDMFQSPGIPDSSNGDWKLKKNGDNKRRDGNIFYTLKKLPNSGENAVENIYGEVRQSDSGNYIGFGRFFSHRMFIPADRWWSSSNFKLERFESSTYIKYALGVIPNLIGSSIIHTSFSIIDDFQNSDTNTTAQLNIVDSIYDSVQQLFVDYEEMDEGIVYASFDDSGNIQGPAGDMLNRYTELRNTLESLQPLTYPSERAIVIFNAMKRAWVLRAYRYLNLIRREVTNWDNRYSLRWSNSSISAIKKYIPEFNDTERFFRDLGSTNDDAMEECNELYIGELNTVYDLVTEVLGLQDMRSANPPWWHDTKVNGESVPPDPDDIVNQPRPTL
jgi:hypothetical protein